MKTSANFRLALLVVLAAALALGASPMTTGKADLKSAGPLSFGPNGILFVGDSMSAKIFAIDTGDVKDTCGGPGCAIDIKGINTKIAAMLGTTADQIAIHDIAVNPLSSNVYISVARGKGADGIPVILRLDSAGKISEFRLDNVKYASATLPNPPDRANQRVDTITEVRYVSGKVLVAGLSNEEFQSNLRSIPYPFESVDKGALIEMYHGSHARYETNSPVRTFVPYTINNQEYILAAYTCTPLVKIPVSELKGGAKVKGTTIAELGAVNRPLDMISYKKDGHDYILMANSARGVMKLDAAHLETYQPITAPTDITGVPYKTLDDWKGVQHLEKFNDKLALVLAENNGSSDLRTVALP